MMNMPSFIVSSDDDDDGLQNSSALNTHVAMKCETNVGDADVALAAILCKQHPAHHECGGASAHYAEKVDDNFQPSESTEHCMHDKEQDIGGRIMPMMEKDVVGMKSGIWEDIVPINNMQTSDGWQSARTSSIVLAHHQHDIQCADHGVDEEEACLTPTTKEHRIPPEILMCPPPPRKKRRGTASLSLPDCVKVVRKRLCYAMPPSSASSSANFASSAEYMHLQQQYAAACQVVAVSPPDLHTFPACIRALFFHD